MRLLGTLVLVVAALFTAGCGELAAQRRYDRSMPMGTPVQANGISAPTPTTHLLLKQTAAGFRLDDPDGFDVYAVQHATRADYDKMVAKDRKNAVRLQTMPVQARGGPLTMHVARYDKGAMAIVTHYTYFGSDDDGIIVEYATSYFKTAFEKDPALPEPKIPFMRFIDTIQFEPRARR